MKRIIAITMILIAGGVIGLKLYFNKKAIQENAEISGIVVTKFPVMVAEIRKEKLNLSFSINGAFEPVRELSFVSETQGRVVNVLVETGDYVQEGQLIARLDAEQINNELALAEANYEKTFSELKRFEELARGNAVTAQQLEEIKISNKTAKTNLTSARKQLKNSQIKAPVPGIINSRYIEKGSYLMPGMPIVQIVDVRRLKIIVNVSETDVLQIIKGQEVVVHADLFQGEKYTGKVRSISVKADETKNYEVEIELENNPDKQLKAGMNGTVTFNEDKTKSALTIPRESITGSLKDPKIYTVGNNSMAHLREIKIGKVVNNMVEILDGVTEGEKIVISGQINIHDGSVVSIIK
ncbi:MAG: efflux RND transporter periplasmic adaptor subunit [Bacteroidetes bacterium]|nr:MAG: efflux RND transporter periplasmic adaptor subunit [Bacteroidota bacterium]